MKLMVREKLLQELHALGQLRSLEPEFSESLKALSDNDFQFLAESIDDSDYSVQEWLIALHEFWKWQVANSKELGTRFHIEYLNCCVQGSVQGGGKLLSLADLFHDYVRIYGVSGSI